MLSHNELNPITRSIARDRRIPVKKVREAFQDSLSIAGFPPSSPPLLEMSGSDFRNVRVQGSISISSFDCTSALSAIDFNFDTRMDRCQAEMQSNSRFQFQLLKQPLSHRNAIEISISISALETTSLTQKCNRNLDFDFSPRFQKRVGKCRKTNL